MGQKNLAVLTGDRINEGFFFMWLYYRGDRKAGFQNGRS